MLRHLFTKPVIKFLAAGLLLILLAVCGVLIFVRTHTVHVPVLMYHHIDRNVGNDMIVSPERLEEQIAALAGDGWHSVSIQQLIDYVDHGTPLPEKPVLITFDDGYTSNLTLAAPILEKYGQRAVIYVIGINAGQEVYAHTGEPLSPPRFALEDAIPYIQSGVVELQSHTFDLHQRSDYAISGRDGVLPIPGESKKVYMAAILEDARQQQELFSEKLGIPITSLAYPFGLCCDESEAVMKDLGIRVTHTTFPGNNPVRQYVPSSLRQLYRHTITDRVTGQELLTLISQP